MTNEIEIFNNPKFGEVRGKVVNGEPYLVGKDVASALGYARTADAIRVHVDPEDKGVFEMQTPGGVQNMTFISESGVYSLIMSSKLPSAREFKHWVTSDVLPSIRKHGAYITKDTAEKIMTDPDFMIRLLQEIKEEREKSAAQAKKIEEDRPKVVFADAVAASKTSILIGELAKLLKQNGIDIGQKRLFAWMREHGYLIKSGSAKNMPTQRAMDMGLFEVKEGSYVAADGSNRTTRTTKVTGKGQQYFINKFLGEKDKNEKAENTRVRNL